MTRAVACPVVVLLSCLVASTSYIGAVTQPALVSMVLPLVLVVGLVGLRLRARPWAGWIAVVAVAGTGGEVVNLVSGNYQGSVARSAGAAAHATGVAVLLSATRRPALFLLPVAGIVAWALALGAAARVQLLVALTAASAMLALAVVERDARTYVRPPRLGARVLASVVLALAAAVFAAHFQLQHNDRPAASPFRESLATTIEPPAFLSLTRDPPPSATDDTPTPLPSTKLDSPAAAATNTAWRRLLLAVTALFAALVLSVLVRLFWVALSWRRLRRRLQRRVTPPEAGAWLWATAVLDRLSTPLPAQLSPDQVTSQPSLALLHGLAERVTPAVFAAPGQQADNSVWPTAREAADSAWHSASRGRRFLALWRTPRVGSGSPRVPNMPARVVL